MHAMEGAVHCPPHAAWICDALEWKDFFPLFGSALVAATALTIAVIATWWLNTTIKRTEFFLKFTERFHDILTEVDVENANATSQPPGARRRKAHALYRQFFGLMFDEWYAYRCGFLDPRAYTEWMIWRYFDSNPPQQAQRYIFEIGGVPYLAGWQLWKDKPAFAGHPFVAFMEEVHRARRSHTLADSEIRTLVARNAPLIRRPFARFRLWIIAHRAFVIVVAVFIVMFFMAILANSLR
jgi:hypothetical protein